jgi:hypothetical protein
LVDSAISSLPVARKPGEEWTIAVYAASSATRKSRKVIVSMR